MSFPGGCKPRPGGTCSNRLIGAPWECAPTQGLPLPRLEVGEDSQGIQRVLCGKGKGSLRGNGPAHLGPGPQGGVFPHPFLLSLGQPDLGAMVQGPSCNHSAFPGSSPRASCHLSDLCPTHFHIPLLDHLSIQASASLSPVPRPSWGITP
jgi:hypothetical protein